MVQDVDDRLRCPLDEAHSRPVVCDSCGATRFRNLRAGVSRVREELEALAGRPVLEVTTETDAGLLDVGGASVFVGTEAVLHRIQRRVARVVFLEFDQELLAPRMRASEQAMALLVRASRLLGPRSAGGRLMVQTRQPDHEVLQAVLHADPGRLVPDEKERRSLLGQPPFAALARVSGAVAPEFMARLGSPDGIDVMGPRDGSWLVRARDHDQLSEALLAVSRPAGRLRLEVDPRRA
jgi:primosomal protein N' (replication factor Y)